MTTDIDLDDVAAQSQKAQQELKELRDLVDAASDALDYLTGLTTQQAAALRKDANRYRYLRDRVPAEVLGQVKSAAGCWIDGEDDEGVLILLTGDDADAAIDAAMAAAMAAAPAVGAA